MDDELLGPWRLVFLGRLVIHIEEETCPSSLAPVVSG